MHHYVRKPPLSGPLDCPVCFLTASKVHQELILDLLTLTTFPVWYTYFPDFTWHLCSLPASGGQSWDRASCRSSRRKIWMRSCWFNLLQPILHGERYHVLSGCVVHSGSIAGRWSRGLSTLSKITSAGQHFQILLPQEAQDHHRRPRRHETSPIDCFTWHVRSIKTHTSSFFPGPYGLPIYTHTNVCSLVWKPEIYLQLLHHPCFLLICLFYYL